ncbi:protein-glutamate methylesterase/protein-glutamine glutaminase [Thiocystis violascens]|uniref:Protein-glutamate methylesterase/protein-glutamine glutaminase n=1 Tax=Thiocystis violascens (strain ATCC 17096 / DSM 198 / 6111) TaxID=765911 RepID=I3Y632_THIV6|nr:chemotaxis response regulator protein-glutamate methylesterase [Thiocystis violascens]AFL72450.1 chemotaxis response regulator containing a CheY-like receiver domain and a methylesterase domain [Thiocystis violascens DSM 198]
MALRVVVVDDSGFFRRRIVEILNADIGIEVVGTAANGLEGIEVVKRLNPDVVTMDIEMPVMDGITAVRRIMAESPRPVLMFSTLTTEGARATLDALDAGAMDFLPKRFSEIAKDEDAAKVMLRRRVRALARTRHQALSRPAARERPSTHEPELTAPSARRAPVSATPLHSLRAVLIGTSTGGPVALQEVLKVLPKSFPLPIILVQHMPASFTPAFAERLNNLCQIEVREAVSGDVLKPGCALLAPGGQQLVLEGGAQTRVRIQENPPGTIYKPSVDITFQSAVTALKSQVLAVVLTGMGADGREGTRALQGQGAHVWAQDAASSVVFGMPAAVIDAGLADHVLALKDVGPALVKGFC